MFTDLFSGSIDAATSQWTWQTLSVLLVAAGLGAALGIVRPVRNGIVPRSAHVIQAQILLCIVGAVIVVVVAESLARAFAVVGAAGLIRYRSRIEDPKDASVMLLSLTVGLAVGARLFLFAAVVCLFVIVVLWILESFEPAAHSRFNLKIVAKNAPQLQPDIESAMNDKGVAFELRGSAHDELLYEVTVPYHAQIKKLTRIIRDLNAQRGTSVEWEIKKYETLAS
jgi:uncharacterized membrane protein YhiD involved in acid resistance